jgi:hypothetical protein
VEMDTPFGLDLGLIEEQIHEHGFAAADRPVQVHASRRQRAAPDPAETLEEARAPNEAVPPQLVIQGLQPGDRGLLNRVGPQIALLEKRAVGGQRSVGHVGLWLVSGPGRS